jgi:hypothetical protein
MTADYTLKLQDGELPLVFNNKMLKDYSRSKGIEYEDLERAVLDGMAFKINDISDILLIGHKTWCLYNGQEFTKTELDACAWIDQIEYVTNDVIRDIFLVFGARVLRMDPETLKANLKPVVSGGIEEEKKSLTAVA